MSETKNYDQRTVDMAEVLVQEMMIQRMRQGLEKVLQTSFPQLMVDHVRFQGGVEPIEREGITFFAVHENDGIRSHIGLADSEKYVMEEKVACQCGECDDVGAYYIVNVRDMLRILEAA